MEQIRALFSFLPGETEGALTSSPLTTLIKQRAKVAQQLKCLLITAGSFAADAAKEYSPLKHIDKVHVVIFDEAQSFGKWLETILMHKLRLDGFILTTGDENPPGGGVFG